MSQQRVLPDPEESGVRMLTCDECREEVLNIKQCIESIVEKHNDNKNMDQVSEVCFEEFELINSLT